MTEPGSITCCFSREQTKLIFKRLYFSVCKFKIDRFLVNLNQRDNNCCQLIDTNLIFGTRYLQQTSAFVNECGSVPTSENFTSINRFGSMIQPHSLIDKQNKAHTVFLFCFRNSFVVLYFIWPNNKINHSHQFV